MGMNVGAADDSGEDQLNNSINTTPLVDVMLVLLIIFLITIPVVTQSVKLELPKERNLPTQTKPENIVLAVNRDGEVYWGLERMPDNEALVSRLKIEAVKEPQPEVHIRGDSEVRYEAVGRIVVDCQRAGIFKVGFITEPPPGGGTRLK
jgi:biopolymer transport protein ExbD